jgi:hypothetical protein
MTRKTIDKERLYLCLSGVTGHLGASRVKVVDTLLIVDLAGVGTPSYRKEASDRISRAGVDCGVVCYIMHSPVRPDSSLYRDLTESMQGYMGINRLHPEEVPTVQATNYGLHISFPSPLSQEMADDIADTLDTLVDRVVGKDAKPLRYLVTSPGGHAMREYGVSVPTEIRGAPELLVSEQPHKAVPEERPAGARRTSGDKLTMEEVVDFCIVLHHPGNKDMDALELIELLDQVGGTGDV